MNKNEIMSQQQKRALNMVLWFIIAALILFYIGYRVGKDLALHNY